MFRTWKEKLGLVKDDNLVIYSPIKGKACSLSEVNDPVFQDKILGDGLAIIPRSGRVVAPADGTVGMVFETGHAVSIVSDQGAEILIHIGLDTVNLKGEFFKAHVKAGDKVKTGDLLLEFDLEQIRAAGYDTISPIVICNTPAYSEIIANTGREVKELDQILKIKK